MGYSIVSKIEPRTLLIGLIFLLVGCGPQALLYDVVLEPTTISPNADGVEDVARIQYKLSRPALISIYFEDDAGLRYVFRDNNPRPAGEYEALFGGAIDGAVLPEGEYTWYIGAVEVASGRAESAGGQLTLRDPDDQRPQLIDFTVFPEVFTPNQDGLSDRVAIHFRLEEPVRAQVYLEDAGGQRYPLGKPLSAGQQEEIDPLADPLQILELEPGFVQFDYDGGIDKGVAPPPDGEYRVVAIATDRAGNENRQEKPLAIREGGLPLAEVKFVEFFPTTLALGDTLHITFIVENVGSIPIRTTGPPPGTTYPASQNFNTLGFYEEPGAFRLGVDFEGNSFGRVYSYRWQLGSRAELEVRVVDGREVFYLLPGRRVTVTGQIVIDEAPPRSGPHFWAGLVHEDVRIVNDRLSPTLIDIGF